MSLERGGGGRNGGDGKNKNRDQAKTHTLAQNETRLGDRGGTRKCCSPLAVELLDPVHDEAETQTWGADGQELGLLVLVDRERLYR